MKSYLKSTVKSIKIYYTISADPARLILMQLARQNGPARLKQAGPAQSSSKIYQHQTVANIFV